MWIVLGFIGIIAIVVAIVLKIMAVESVYIYESSVELRPGDSIYVHYGISPSNAFNAEATWTSSDESVATVSSDAKITGKSGGSCIITLTAGGKTASLTVTVKTGPRLLYAFSSVLLFGLGGF